MNVKNVQIIFDNSTAVFIFFEAISGGVFTILTVLIKEKKGYL